MITINIDEDEQVILYKYEVESLRRTANEYAALVQRLRDNEQMLKDLQDRGPTTAIYHTADDLACFVRGNHSLPRAYRALKTDPAKGWDTTPEWIKRNRRTYVQGKTIETFNGVYATYHEDTTNNQ